MTTLTQLTALTAAMAKIKLASESMAEASGIIAAVADDIAAPVIDVPPEPDTPPEPDSPPSGQSMPFDNLNDARADFRQRYSTEPADCDPNADGLWVCYDRTVGSNADTPIDDEPPTIPVEGDTVVRKLPRQADNTWKYNTNSHDALFTGAGPNGQPRQWFAFWADNERLHIAQRDFPDGEWSEPVDIHAGVCGDIELEWDSHNSIAVGQCPQSGFLFVTGNHHSDRLNLGISRNPGDIGGGWDRFNDGRIDGDAYHGRMTYPSINTVGLGDEERLVISVRDQKAGDGMARFKWCVMIWNPTTRRLHNVNLNTGLELRLYASNLARRDSDGTIHLSCIWRDQTEGAARGSWQKQDHWHMFSPDGYRWYQYKDGDSVEIQLPLIWKGTSKTWKSGVAYLPAGYEPPELIWDSSKGDPVPNSTNGQGSIVIGRDGEPHIMHASSDGKIWHTWFDGDEWRHSVLPFTPHSEDPIPYADDAGLIAHVDDDEVWFVDLAHESPSLTLGNRISKGGLNGGVSIVTDHGAQRLGYVSYAVTTVKSNSNDQNRNNARPSDHDADVHVITVALDRLQRAEGVVL